MADQKFILNEIANQPDWQLTITPREDPTERDSRLKIEEANAQHLRIKELVLHGVTALVVLVVVGVCAWIVIKKGLVTDEGKLALGLLTNIVTALVAYVTGRSSK